MLFRRPLRWALLAACCYAMMTVSFVNAGHSLWMPVIAPELQLSGSGAGVMLSCAFWGMVVAVLGAGPLADRIGFRPLLVGCAVSQAVGLWLVSGAATLGSAAAGVLIASVGTGGLLTATFPICFALYPESRTAISNILISFCSVGAVIVGALGALQFARAWAWQDVYQSSAALTVPYGLAFLLLPLPAVARPDADRPRIAPLLKHRAFHLILFGGFVAALVIVGSTIWLPRYLTQVPGGSFNAAAISMIVTAGAGVLGNWLNASAVRLLGVRWLATLGGGIAAAGLVTAAAATQPSVIIASFVVMMLGMAGLSPALLANAGDRYPRAGATMYALLNAVANTGCAVGVLTVGLLDDVWGLAPTLRLMALGPVVVAGIILVLVPRTKRPAVAPA